MGQDAAITLYTCSKDTSKLFETAKKQFESIAIDTNLEDHILTITLFDETICRFYLTDDEQEVTQQVQGMRAYFAQAPCERKELHESVLLQISLFTSIMGIEFSIDEQEERTNAIIGRIYAIANACASIVLYPDMSLYTSKGELLLNIEGESEKDVYYPVSNSDILDENRAYDERDQKRFLKIKEEIEGRRFPMTKEILSTQVTLDSMKVPDTEYIAKRLCAVLACSICAEGVLMEGGSKDIGLAQFVAFDQRFGCGSYLSNEERAFIEGDMNKQEAIAMSWRYECANVLMWSLGLIDITFDYEYLCDVASMMQVMNRFKNFEDILQHVNVVDPVTLLDVHTKTLYYHRSCVEAQVKQIELEGINAEIIQEQHYALNWLTYANKTRNWDAISCHT